MKLLDLARDCFHFVTKFFEAISASATHIYHSALQLSPRSSIVRRLYHSYTTPSPSVVVGQVDPWQPSIATPNKEFPFRSCAWSPRGQFIAAQTQEVVEVRDPLTFELLSTLQPPNPAVHLTGPLAYSPDGRSLCCASNTTIVIWDIQTGGLTKEIEFDAVLDGLSLLVWSSDERMIGAVLSDGYTWSVATCHVVSGIIMRGTLVSADKPYLWSHNKSFCVMTTSRDDEDCTIQVFKVGATLTRVRSFVIFILAKRGPDFRVESFSPVSSDTSISVTGKNEELLILNDQSQICLREQGAAGSHCFSSDGKLFAASLDRVIRVWTRGRDRYSTWREFPDRSWSFDNLRLWFSPTSSSILGHFADVLQVWRFDGLRTSTIADSEQYAILSHHGSYIASAHGNTVTVTNLISQTLPQFIDIDTRIAGLALAGNVLLVADLQDITAWRLTEVGVVEGISGNRRAGRGDTIWVLPSITSVLSPEFCFQGQVGFIRSGGFVICSYHIWTGKKAECTPELLQRSDGHWYSLEVTSRGQCRLPRHDMSQRDDLDNRPVPQTTLREGWVKDPEGKHRLWLPIEWRTAVVRVEWSHYIPTLRVELPKGKFLAVAL